MVRNQKLLLNSEPPTGQGRCLAALPSELLEERLTDSKLNVETAGMTADLSDRAREGNSITEVTLVLSTLINLSKGSK